MIQFDYNYEFILLSHENFKTPIDNINFYITQMNENIFTLLIQELESSYDYNYNYTILIFEEKENEEENELFNKLNNPCYYFQFFDKNFSPSDYNYLIIYATPENNQKFIYEEIDLSKFSKKKNLYIKILTYHEKYKTIYYSNVKKIYIENILQNNEDIIDNEAGIINIDENKEYNINNNEYIFKYHLKKNILNILPTIFLTYYNTYNNQKSVYTELEIINPFLLNFTYSLKSASTIALTNQTIIKDYGDYYFIFRNCLGIKFYIHNTANVFLLNNEISNYYTDSIPLIPIIYFSLNLTEEKYIFFGSPCTFIFIQKNQKK